MHSFDGEAGRHEMTFVITGKEVTVMEETDFLEKQVQFLLCWSLHCDTNDFKNILNMCFT